MNKGFFVVFLGIILGAMALIFVNQPSSPVVASIPAQQGATPESGNAAPAQAPAGTAVASLPQNAPQPPAKPEPAAPAKPEPVKPEAPKPEPAKPETAKPEAPKPEAPKPEPAKPEAAKPEAPAQPVKPEAPKPETPKPETPKPEAPKPEAPKPETPAQPASPPVAMTPVTSKPETQANPGGAQTKKALTLVNIGLHFKGNGMILRLEADAPFSYKTFALASPDRYVVDLVGAWNKMRAPTVPSNNMIKGARAGSQPGGPRLVLDMARAPKKHNVTWISPTVLEILIE